MDNINMTDEQMQKLIDGLAEGLVKRIYGIQNPAQEDNDMMWYADRDDDHCVGELARLMTLLNMYEEKEQYNKAAIIKRKLDIIQNRLDKL